MLPDMSREVGRVRIKLAAMLSRELGVPVIPEELWVQNPAYSRLWGCALWGGFTSNRRSLCSWSRMSDCLKYGFTITRGGTNAYADIEISAKEAQ
jgi:hypothetical protein